MSIVMGITGEGVRGKLSWSESGDCACSSSEIFMTSTISSCSSSRFGETGVGEGLGGSDGNSWESNTGDADRTSSITGVGVGETISAGVRFNGGVSLCNSGSREGGVVWYSKSSVSEGIWIGWGGTGSAIEPTDVPDSSISCSKISSISGS